MGIGILGVIGRPHGGMGIIDGEVTEFPEDSGNRVLPRPFPGMWTCMV